MLHKYQIESIIPYGYDYHSKYTYENYLNKTDYQWYKFEITKYDDITKTETTSFVTKKEIYFKLILTEEEKVKFSIINPYNSSKHFRKLFLKTSYFFKKFKTSELFEILAILNKEQPYVEFAYFEKGEKYGYDDYTVVKYNNKIIKYFFVFFTDKKLTIDEYYSTYKIDKNESEISALVKEYLDELELDLEIYYNRKQEEQDAYISRLNDDSYSIEDSYYDGGGGDEWSDPTEFW